MRKTNVFITPALSSRNGFLDFHTCPRWAHFSSSSSNATFSVWNKPLTFLLAGLSNLKQSNRRVTEDGSWLITFKNGPSKFQFCLFIVVGMKRQKQKAGIHIWPGVAPELEGLPRRRSECFGEMWKLLLAVCENHYLLNSSLFFSTRPHWVDQLCKKSSRVSALILTALLQSSAERQAISAVQLDDSGFWQKRLSLCLKPPKQ